MASALGKKKPFPEVPETNRVPVLPVLDATEEMIEIGTRE